MSLSPQVLLSTLSRENCVSKIKCLPYMVPELQHKPKTAAVLVPLCVVNGEVSLLYTLRSRNLKNHSGQVSFPGGKSDENENFVDTALRETEEELGISKENIEIWSEMPQLQGRDKNMLITPIVGVIRDFEMTKLKPNMYEVDTVFTVSVNDLCNPDNHGHLDFNNFMLPVFIYDSFKIWGITGLITHTFLQCFIPSELYKVNFLHKSFTMDELMPSKL